MTLAEGNEKTWTVLTSNILLESIKFYFGFAAPLEDAAFFFLFDCGSPASFEDVPTFLLTLGIFWAFGSADAVSEADLMILSTAG